MKYLLILALIGCTQESNPVANTTQNQTQTQSQDDVRLCRLPVEILDSLLQADRITEQDIRRCRPLSEYGL